MNEHIRATIGAAMQVLALLALAAFLFTLSLMPGPQDAQPDPHRTYHRPATAEQIEQRQGDQLMDDLAHAYQEGQR